MKPIMEQYEQALAEFSRGMPWIHENVARKQRWDRYFNPAHPAWRGQPDVQHLVDLDEDEHLNRMKVSKAERMRRRYITEHAMDLLAAEAAAAQRQSLMETTTTSNIASFTTWSLPLVRKIWPRLFMHEITSVQPMNQPTGKLFTLDFLYGTAGDVYGTSDSLYGNVDPAYADDPGEGQEPNEVNLKVTSVDITAISKKLKSAWNIEAEQDLLAQHGLGMEQEQVKMLGMEIEREINQYCIGQLYDNAYASTNWDSTQPESTNPWANATPRQYAESLWDAIEDANRKIKNEVFVNANFILCGTTFASRLRKLNGFRLAFSDDALQTDVVTGPNLFGTLNGRYILYEDPIFAGGADHALIGHKGATWLYTGSAYCPYVPMWRTPIVPNTKMQPAFGYLTRFAFKVVNSKFYGTVTTTAE